jgi:hypothetical protein
MRLGSTYLSPCWQSDRFSVDGKHVLRGSNDRCVVYRIFTLFSIVSPIAGAIVLFKSILHEFLLARACFICAGRNVAEYCFFNVSIVDFTFAGGWTRIYRKSV